MLHTEEYCKDLLHLAETLVKEKEKLKNNNEEEKNP